MPLTTLRDRVDNRDDLDCTKSGPDPLLTQIEEGKLVGNLKDYKLLLVMGIRGHK